MFQKCIKSNMNNKYARNLPPQMLHLIEMRQETLKAYI